MSKYLEILFRHRLRFLTLLVVLPVTLAAACIVLFPRHMSSGSIWVDVPAYIPISPAANGWNQYLTPAQNTADALNQLRGTNSFNESLFAKLDESHAFKDASERDATYGTVIADVSVLPTGSHLVTVTYTCPRAALCTSLLAELIRLYHKWLTDQESAQAQVAIDFYSAQLKSAQTTLANEQSALVSYVNSHPGLRPTDSTLNPEYDRLLASVERAKVTVAAFQSKLTDTKLADAAMGQIDSTTFNVVDPPRSLVSGRLGSLPRKQMTIAAAGAFALGIAVLVLMAWSDRTTREPKELESILRLPVVVTVPDFALMEATDG